jgi:hypothetical protein
MTNTGASSPGMGRIVVVVVDDVVGVVADGVIVVVVKDGVVVVVVVVIVVDEGCVSSPCSDTATGPFGPVSVRTASLTTPDGV